jgi:surface antigen
MSRQSLFAALFVFAFLGAYASPPSKDDVGTATGAVLGAFVGGRIGKSMDDNGQRKTVQGLEVATDNLSTAWRNPKTGHSYSVTHTNGSATSPCRDFTATAEFDGRQEVVHGTACRQPDGGWKTA